MAGAIDWLPAEVLDRSVVRSLEAGAALFRQGDKATAIFAVESGRMRLVRHTASQHPIVLHTAREGELFAEAALFADAYHCDAVAVSASRVRAVPKRPLLAAFRNNPDVAERFMAVLAHQIHVLRARLEERNIRSARERLLHRLALMADRALALEGTAMELAAELGLTHEALYRTLAALEKEGLIVRTRSEIRLREKPPV